MTEVEKHTSGPWELDGTGWICDPEGSPVCLINAGLADHDLSTQEKADASLIAAAPDLLEALQSLLAKHEAHHNSIEHAAARKVVAKATQAQP